MVPFLQLVTQQNSNNPFQYAIPPPPRQPPEAGPSPLPSPVLPPLGAPPLAGPMPTAPPTGIHIDFDTPAMAPPSSAYRVALEPLHKPSPRPSLGSSGRGGPSAEQPHHPPAGGGKSKPAPLDVPESPPASPLGVVTPTSGSGAFWARDGDELIQLPLTPHSLAATAAAAAGSRPGPVPSHLPPMGAALTAHVQRAAAAPLVSPTGSSGHTFPGDDSAVLPIRRHSSNPTLAPLSSRPLPAPGEVALSSTPSDPSAPQRAPVAPIPEPYGAGPSFLRRRHSRTRVRSVSTSPVITPASRAAAPAPAASSTNLQQAPDEGRASFSEATGAAWCLPHPSEGTSGPPPAAPKATVSPRGGTPPSAPAEPAGPPATAETAGHPRHAPDEFARPALAAHPHSHPAALSAAAPSTKAGPRAGRLVVRPLDHRHPAAPAPAPQVLILAQPSPPAALAPASAEQQHQIPDERHFFAPPHRRHERPDKATDHKEPPAEGAARPPEGTGRAPRLALPPSEPAPWADGSDEVGSSVCSSSVGSLLTAPLDPADANPGRSDVPQPQLPPRGMLGASASAPALGGLAPRLPQQLPTSLPAALDARAAPPQVVQSKPLQTPDTAARLADSALQQPSAISPHGTHQRAPPAADRASTPTIPPSSSPSPTAAATTTPLGAAPPVTTPAAVRATLSPPPAKGRLSPPPVIIATPPTSPTPLATISPPRAITPPRPEGQLPRLHSPEATAILGPSVAALIPSFLLSPAPTPAPAPSAAIPPPVASPPPPSPPKALVPVPGAQPQPASPTPSSASATSEVLAVPPVSSPTPPPVGPATALLLGTSTFPGMAPLGPDMSFFDLALAALDERAAQLLSRSEAVLAPAPCSPRAPEGHQSPPAPRHHPRAPAPPTRAAAQAEEDRPRPPIMGTSSGTEERIERVSLQTPHTHTHAHLHVAVIASRITRLLPAPPTPPWQAVSPLLVVPTAMEAVSPPASPPPRPPSPPVMAPVTPDDLPRPRRLLPATAAPPRLGLAALLTRPVVPTLKLAPAQPPAAPQGSSPGCATPPPLARVGPQPSRSPIDEVAALAAAGYSPLKPPIPPPPPPPSSPEMPCPHTPPMIRTLSPRGGPTSSPLGHSPHPPPPHPASVPSPSPPRAGEEAAGAIGAASPSGAAGSPSKSRAARWAEWAEAQLTDMLEEVVVRRLFPESLPLLVARPRPEAGPPPGGLGNSWDSTLSSASSATSSPSLPSPRGESGTEPPGSLLDPGGWTQGDMAGPQPDLVPSPSHPLLAPAAPQPGAHPRFGVGRGGQATAAAAGPAALRQRLEADPALALLRRKERSLQAQLASVAHLTSPAGAHRTTFSRSPPYNSKDLFSSKAKPRR
ncbi:hypothetical protein PAPYR_92 [Paratrimastix pyriformis]|uniref:Uncharacterized protein n=1 Tax=Paratrimastix pyriformis TaxID=342808 RepID=A0ABQ8UUU2_9EUKA|nr:hypothetical protein PAPYR_92 [Paratrimastix pyriformis]